MANSKANSRVPKGKVATLFGSTHAVVELNRGTMSVPAWFVMSQGAQFGDNIFEGLLAVDGRIRALRRHLSRFTANAKALGIRIPNQTAMRALLRDGLAGHRSGMAMIRLMAFRGYTDWGVGQKGSRTDPLTCTVAAVKLLDPSAYSSGVSCALLCDMRKPQAAALDMTIKRGANYSILQRARILASERGADDAILLSSEGFVSEASVENVFWVRKRVLHTPAADVRNNCLPGVTRGIVLDLANRGGVAARVGHYRPAALDSIEEMFLTGTSAGIVPVRQLNGRKLSSTDPGSVTSRLAVRYAEMLRDRVGFEAP